MGNSCCTAELRSDEKYSLNSQTNKVEISRKQNNLKISARSDGIHEPTPNSCNKVSEENILADGTKERLDMLGSHNLAFENIEDLKMLGPYCYPDGSTYSGTYRNGLRHGYGIKIFKDGSMYEGNYADDVA